MLSERHSQRIAAAPISWGVCEVSNWGFQLAPERVLREMSELGLSTTEFGPDGFLPDDSSERTELLTRFGLKALGGFLPVVLHKAEVDPLPAVDAYIKKCLESGANVIVLAAASGQDGYDAREKLSEDEWLQTLKTLDLIAVRAAEHGITATIHPHIGTLIETAEHIDRIVAGSGIGICVDTGHLYVAGSDPVEVVAKHAHRVAHVHLKDVNPEICSEVIQGAIDFSTGITKGLFQPLGEGAIDIAQIISGLERSGYQGWYVLEQDIKLSESPEGVGPVQNVEISLNFVKHNLSQLTHPQP